MTSTVLMPYLVYLMTVNASFNTFYNLNRENIKCMADTIYHESRGESINGQYAVASVVLNRVKSEKFPKSICAVTKQKAHVNGREICAFSWYCENKKVTLDSPLSAPTTDIAKQYKQSIIISVLALTGKLKDVTNGATFFYNPNLCNPSWASNMKITVVYGNHVFLKEPAKKPYNVT